MSQENLAFSGSLTDQGAHAEASAVPARLPNGDNKQAVKLTDPVDYMRKFS